jgi:selenocysteine lyase/cysteine desulfurase
MALAADARRFTQSTMSYLSVVGLTAALDRLLSAGLEAIEQHAALLRDRLLDSVGDRGWRPFRHRGSPAAAAHILSLARPGEAVADVLLRLRGAGIVCGARGGRLRVSLAPYNDETDVRALAAALA